MNRKAIFLLVPLVLIGILINLQSYPYRAVCQGTVGIGVSDYEVNATVEIGANQTFEIARVSNEGTLNLTIKAKWNPDFNSTDARLELRFTPETARLESGQAVLFKAEVVKAEKTGTYTGTITFTTVAELPSGTEGNPVAPGGSAHATFNIIHTPTLLEVILSNLTTVIIATSAALVLSSALLFYRAQNHKPSRKKRK